MFSVLTCSSELKPMLSTQYTTPSPPYPSFSQVRVSMKHSLLLNLNDSLQVYSLLSGNLLRTPFKDADLYDGAEDFALTPDETEVLLLPRNRSHILRVQIVGDDCTPTMLNKCCLNHPSTVDCNEVAVVVGERWPAWTVTTMDWNGYHIATFKMTWTCSEVRRGYLQFRVRRQVHNDDTFFVLFSHGSELLEVSRDGRRMHAVAPMPEFPFQTNAISMVGSSLLVDTRNQIPGFLFSSRRSMFEFKLHKQKPIAEVAAGGVGVITVGKSLVFTETSDGSICRISTVAPSELCATDDVVVTYTVFHIMDLRFSWITGCASLARERDTHQHHKRPCTCR